jgi:hypothetical protein
LERTIKKAEKMKHDLLKKKPEKPVPVEEDPTFDPEDKKPPKKSTKMPVIEEGLDCNKLLNIK